MDYVHEMISLSNDSNLNLSDEEFAELRVFSDEMVKFSTGGGNDYLNNELLKSTLHKIIDKGFFIRYFEILMKRNEYSMDDFPERMDEK